MAPQGFRTLEDEGDGRDARPPGLGGPLPHESSIPLASALFFSWYDPLLKLGQSRALEQDDIWTLPPANSVAEWSQQYASPRGDWMGELIEAKLEAPGEGRKARSGDDGREAPVTTLLMLWRTPLRAMYIRCGLLRLLAEMGSIATPLCLNQIMRFLNDSGTLLQPAGSHSRAEGVLLVVAMFLSSVCQSLALQHYIALCFASGAHAKALIQQRVFKAVCSLPVSTVQDLTAGQLTNLISKDSAKIQDFLLFGHNIWSAPLTALWVTMSLFLVLGWAAVPGVLGTILIIPLQSRLAKYAASLRRLTLSHSDVRQRIMGAFLEGVRVVKLSAWEPEVHTAVQRSLYLSVFLCSDLTSFVKLSACEPEVHTAV